ncbi:hypothetical protein FXB39_15980 [Nocardioides sp. BGMRC 2183]|nr:hypothetical protein FXB39_15980 [Nocardioides sp. BGMRC 2183]
MRPPQHPHDGLVMTGSLKISPPLDRDDVDLLDTVASASLRAAVDDHPSALLDRLVPDHPDGPSGWVTCDQGCCLEVDPCGLVNPDAMEPWLRYLVETLLGDHDISGAIVTWDCADRTFTAMTVEGTKVRRHPVLERPRRDRARASSGRGAAALRSV